MNPTRTVEDVAPILDDELSEAQRLFEAKIVDIFDEFAARGAHRSIALVEAMQKAARAEVRAQAKLIVDAYASRSPPGLVVAEIPEVVADALDRMAKEVGLIETTVTAVTTGNIPNESGFLESQALASRLRLQAELEMLLRRAAADNQLFQLKPQVWGFAVNLKVLWRYAVARLSRRRRDRESDDASGDA